LSLYLYNLQNLVDSQHVSTGNRIKKQPDIYDINYVLDGSEVKQAAVLQHKESGRVLKVSTDAPGMQFHTGNGLKDVKGKGGYVYKPQAGLCLELKGFLMRLITLISLCRL
jgi:aldose 1-epimerase